MLVRSRDQAAQAVGVASVVGVAQEQVASVVGAEQVVLQDQVALGSVVQVATADQDAAVFLVSVDGAVQQDHLVQVLMVRAASAVIVGGVVH